MNRKKRKARIHTREGVALHGIMAYGKRVVGSSSTAARTERRSASLAFVLQLAPRSCPARADERRQSLR